VAARLAIPVLGSGDCVEPEHVIEKLASTAAGSTGPTGIAGVLVGRGVLRNPWILSQAADIAAGRRPRTITLAERGQFLVDYIDLLLNERVDEASGFRHAAPGAGDSMNAPATARGRERWVINKIRALSSWYSKGFDCGSHFRVRVNSCESIVQLRETVDEFFFATPRQTAAAGGELVQAS